MITNLNFFDDTDDLETLTGLNHDQLWNAGFDLDDMDWGFVSDEEYTNDKVDKYGYKYSRIKYDIPQFVYQLLEEPEDHYAGLRHTEYNGKHYYILHHA